MIDSFAAVSPIVCFRIRPKTDSQWQRLALAGIGVMPGGHLDRRVPQLRAAGKDAVALCRSYGTR